MIFKRAVVRVRGLWSLFPSQDVLSILHVNQALFIQQYIMLVAGWVMYCILHSLLAQAGWKRWVEQKTGTWFRYYRIIYSLFATVSLGVLLYYHFSLEPVWVLPEGNWISVAGGFLLSLTGAVIMIVCIRKYFFDLSGVDVFFRREPAKPMLQQKGLHRYTRHPLYLGTLLFAWGIFFLFPFIHHLLACSVMTIYIIVAIQWEEKKLVDEFGTLYTDYAGRVPKLFPGFKKLKFK